MYESLLTSGQLSKAQGIIEVLTCNQRGRGSEPCPRLRGEDEGLLWCNTHKVHNIFPCMAQSRSPNSSYCEGQSMSIDHKFSLKGE